MSDDGIPFFANAGIPKQFKHITQAAINAVQKILALAAAIDTPCHQHFRIRRVQSLILIVKLERNFTVRQRLSRLGTVEYDVFHLGAPQYFGALLTKHPPDGIRNVAFA